LTDRVAGLIGNDKLGIEEIEAQLKAAERSA
jgi:hypothetical protein